MTHGTIDLTASDLLAALRHAPAGPVYDDLLDRIALALEPTIHAIAADLINVFRLDPTTDFDDVVSRVYEAAADMVRELRDGEAVLDEFDALSGVLRFRASSKVRRWIDASRRPAPAPEEQGAKRHIWEMRQTRGDLFAELGREPSMQEVLDATNARLAASPRTNSLMCTEDDWTRMMQPPAVPVDDRPMSAEESAALIQLTIDECRRMDVVTGRVAAEFFAPTLAGREDDHPSIVDAALAVGIVPTAAQHRIEVVKATAKRVLFDHYRVTEVA